MCEKEKIEPKINKACSDLLFEIEIIDFLKIYDMEFLKGFSLHLKNIKKFGLEKYIIKNQKSEERKNEKSS